MPTILIVDDSPISLRMLSYTLREQQYTVITVDRGQAAFALLHTEPIDLLISDLSMPEMDGLTLLRAIRADPDMQQIPVIIMTASGQDEDRIAARQAGIHGFLTKPTSSRELVATVSAALAVAQPDGGR